MGFFTAGNLITLGIALLIFALFRYIDKNNRHKRGLKEYSDALKKEIAVFMEEQERAIKDYGISLNVERDSARELMKRLQLSEEELAGKAAAIAQIDSQIKSYENSLAELDRMTNRVQENMNRIREESAFVESTGKRLNEAKSRLDEMGKELGALETSFERKNTQALERAVDSMLVGAKSTVSDLSATLETIERQVDDHRQEITKIEDKRATDMARDLEHINQILKTAVEQAGERAGKIEDAALANLKEQAEERLRRLKTAEEERLKGYQESAKARILEAQNLIKTFQEEWQAERNAWQTKDKELRDERVKDIQELNASLEDSEKRLAASLEDSEKRLAVSLEDSEKRLTASLEDSGKQLNAAKAAFEEQMRELADRTGRIVSSQQALLISSAEEMRQATLEMTGAKLEEYSEKWQTERSAWESKDKELRDERVKALQEFDTSLEDSEKRLTASLEDSEKRLAASLEDSGKQLNSAKTAFEEQMRELAAQTGRIVSSQQALLISSAEEMRQATLEMTGAKLEEYSEKWQTERSAWESKDKELRDERVKALQEFDASLEDSDKRLAAAKAAFEEQMRELADKTGRMIASQEALLLTTIEEMRQATLEMTGAKLEEYSEKWQTERSAWESKDNALRDKRAKDLQEFNASLEDSEKRLAAAKAVSEKQIQELSERTNQTIASQEALLLKAAEEMKLSALELTEAKLEEYRHAQDVEFRRLETLADDARKLDAELRRSMQDVISRIQEDFSRYELDSAGARKVEFDKFSAAAASLRKDMGEIEKELSTLRSAAYDNVSEKLKGFEDDFFADLSRRSGEIDQRLIEWQDGIGSRLSRMGEEAENERRELERGLTEEMRKQLAARDERLVTSLERLKAETSAFGERIRGEMNAADESMVSLKEQLVGSLEEARRGAEIFIKAEIGKHSLTAAETVKQYQRELDEKLREMAEYIQTRNSEISLLIDASRADLVEAKDGIAGKVRELDDSIEDARRRVRDLTTETDTRIASVRSSVEDTERHIREAVDQAKLIDKAEALRLDLARRIEDLKGDIERLDQRRAEAFQLENDFVKIKRIEDDVNAKMTRFLSERRKIETMESDFNRLLKISQAVEEKLTHVTASDDTLQGMQLQLRKLEEALGTTEEKFQRIERKNQILDNTNDGIDRNFRVLQESEKLSVRIGGDLERCSEDLVSIKASIEKLSGESEKARQAMDKIEVLDTLLEEIEGRIDSMQRARQWVAGAETRLEELNRQAQTQARAIDSLVKGKKSNAVPDLGPGAPPLQKKENVITLAKQGWKADEIAKALKISRGEVELILDMAPRD